MKLIRFVTNGLSEEGNVELVFQRIGPAGLALRSAGAGTHWSTAASNNHALEQVKAVAARDKRVRPAVNKCNRLW